MSYKQFMTAYVEAILGDVNAESETPIGTTFTITDFASETRAKIEEDCRAFYDDYSDTWTGQHVYTSQYTEDELAGHDFWLTRVGHGAGFWDGDWREPAAATLTEACKKLGQQWPVVGDDGQIYLS